MRKYTALTDRLYDYMIQQRSGAGDPVLKALGAETRQLGEVSQMAISPDQAGFLTFLVAAIGARQAVEVGTFTGSSALSIARGLPPTGKLTCFDASDQWTSIARRYWETAGVSDRIDLRLGNAAELLSVFIPPAPLDFVFIDANKDGYDFYYESLLPHVRVGGVIVFDNMLRQGEVLEETEMQTLEARAIHTLNGKLAVDPRIESVLISVADGITLCRKL